MLRLVHLVARLMTVAHIGAATKSSMPVDRRPVMEVTVVVDESLVLTVEDAAILLGISRGLAYELVRRDELPAIRLGRRLVVPRQRLLAMIDGGGARVGS